MEKHKSAIYYLLLKINLEMNLQHLNPSNPLLQKLFKKIFIAFDSFYFFFFFIKCFNFRN